MNEPTPALESQLGDDLLAELADDFLRRCRAGEHPSVDEYAAKHPELAARIRDLFPAVMAMEQSDEVATFDLSTATEHVGATIGRYKLLEQIGEGGFGVVYMAEQQHPVRRKVALKVIKPGMDSRQVVARFEAERQALALMDHEHIAKVLDAGATDSGRPYFVMELVKGVPITEFCDANHLTPSERLELFVPVCQAVQHAHNKGIIHRDLKPTNVLVTVHDTTPVVKVIDFGVAKALGQEMTDKTLFTGFAEMIGTPLYMSPEQAGQSGLDIDTRSDIYSLGVLLYELLTGTTPFTKERFKQAACDEIRRIICEEEPPKPSTRLSDLSRVELAPLPSPSSLASISALRHTEPAKLTKLMRGELDWIVMKALEKDRNRRYETANSFAMDLQRYLADEPVQACPPSTSYRFKKFVRRNKGPMLAASLVLLCLLAGIIGTAWQAVRAEKARQAEAERAEGERLAKERAETNFALAGEAVEKYLVAVTDDPELKQADFNRLRKKLLESALPFFQKIAAEKGDDPNVEAGRGLAYLRLVLLRRALGENEAALQDAESTRAIFARLLTKFPLEPGYRLALANGLHNRALLLVGLGRRAEAEADYRQAIDVMEKLVADSPSAEARQDLAEGYHDLGTLLIALGKHAEAEAALRHAVDSREKLVVDFPKNPENRQKLALSHGMMGGFWANLGEHEKAKAAIARGLDVQEKLVAEFPDELMYTAHLALHLNELGKLHLEQLEFNKAEPKFREALGIHEKLVAAFPTVPSHKSSLADSYENLGIALVGQQKFSDAEAAFQEAVGIREKFVAAFPTISGHQLALARACSSLGNVLSDLGKLQPAEATYRKSLEISEKIAADYSDVPGFDENLGGACCNFGILLRDSGQPEAALEWLQKAVMRLEGVLAKEPRLFTAREFLRNSQMARADVLIALGRRDEALKSREKEVALNEGLLGPDHDVTLTSMWVLIGDYDAVGRFEDALRLRKEMLTRRKRTLSADDPDTLGAMANVANGYENLDRNEEARKLREEVVALMKVKIPDHPYTLTTMRNLASSYAILGRHQEALALREELMEQRKATLGPDDPETISSMCELAESLIACDRGAEAIPLIDDCVRRVDGKEIDPRLVPLLFDMRFGYFEKQKDAAGCRTTAEMWERLNRTDAESLYSAAHLRGATATVTRASDTSDKASQSVVTEADRAMDWLAMSVTAGFSDVARIEKDGKLDILRDREDFQKLVTRLKAQAAEKSHAGASSER